MSVQPYPAEPYQPTMAAMTQQQMTTNVTIVNQQPAGLDQNKLIIGPLQGHRGWTTDLFGCCDDCGSTCYTLLCPTCVLWSIAIRLGENCCVADCIPGGTILLRTRLRTIGGIRGDICGDYCAVSCCPLCVICQMDRETRAMGL